MPLTRKGRKLIAEAQRRSWKKRRRARSQSIRSGIRAARMKKHPFEHPSHFDTPTMVIEADGTARMLPQGTDPELAKKLRGRHGYADLEYRRGGV